MIPQPSPLAASFVAPPHYDNVELLGEGGMGRVLQATDTVLERKVAIKTLHERFLDDPEISGRFALEARCTGQLDHPGIPPVYEMGSDGEGRPYFAMKLIKGDTLGQILTRLRAGDEATHQIFSFEHRLTMAAALCDALAYAHSLNWLHRDIKPDNIMVGPYGEVYLTDWGIARQFSSPEVTPSPVDPFGDEDISDRLTRPESCIGTPGYCPPEQIISGAVDARTDVFALGVTLFELFTLTPAFGGKTLNAVLLATLNNQVPMADGLSSPVQGRVPREVAYVLQKTLEKDPTDRYQTVLELRKAVQLVIDGQFPVQCLCTGTKRSLGALAEFVDNYRGLAASLLVFWFIAPVLLAFLMWYVLPRGV